MKFTIMFFFICFATCGCANRQGVTDSVEYGYAGWACDELARELARVDPSFARQQKSEVERAMMTKGCIRPLAAETE
ncbi:MAG: hypothetical protein GY798_14145 [Hyphomicrobiales bacterium]|nr:hypothetical protein [Hyphomicrobiales bacterium]